MKISRICSASSVNTLDDFMQTLNREVEQTGIQFLIDSGWDDSTARDYFSCRTSYKEDSSMIEVAVGAELDFDELMELAETLDTVINKYDENAYFDAEDTGRLSAYLEVPQNIEMSATTIEASANMTEYWYDRKRGYSIHYTEIDSSPEADPMKMLKEFRAQITKTSPYDDAEYYWAQLADGVISIIYEGHVKDKAYYFSAEDMDCENEEWANIVCQNAMDILDKYNKNISKKMIYNSEDIMGYYDNIEPPLDPPDDPDYIEKDEYQDEIDFEFDTNIFVAANGNYDVDDDSKVFIDQGEYEKFQSYYSDEFGEVYLCDTGDCITNLLDKIETLVPAQRGMYHIHGYITFVYDVDGVIAYPHKGHSEDDYYEDVDTSGAHATYNEEETEVKDFTIQPLPHQRVQKK